MDDTEITYEWPDNYPEEVPPEDSIPAKGIAYRFVKKIPPDENDFLMSREEVPDRNLETEIDIARSYGVSLFTKPEALEKKRRYHPLSKIVFGTLVPELGKMSKKPSRRKHFTLWKCCNSKPHLHINKELKTK
ncbi:MAG: hypothetical protein IIA77_06730 [Proteobacteria bacterium]|nr:hypothetical protein [Pseudomonadota bacterium]